MQPAESKVDLQEIAQSIKARGLTVPAIFLLEMHKPLATVASMAVSATQPFLEFILAKKSVERAALVCSSRENMEELIKLLEEPA